MNASNPISPPCPGLSVGPSTSSLSLRSCRQLMSVGPMLKCRLCPALAKPHTAQPCEMGASCPLHRWRNRGSERLRDDQVSHSQWEAELGSPSPRAPGSKSKAQPTGAPGMDARIKRVSVPHPPDLSEGLGEVWGFSERAGDRLGDCEWGECRGSSLFQEPRTPSCKQTSGGAARPGLDLQKVFLRLL